MTVSEYLDTYTRTLRPRLRWSASRQYWLDRAAVLCHDQPAALQAACLYDLASSWPLAPSSRNQLLASLAPALDAARDVFGLPEVSGDPARQALRRLRDAGLAEKSRPRAARVSDRDLAAIMARWTSSVPAAALVVLRDTAMRSGELGRLTWADVDLGARTVTLRNRKGGYTDTVPLLGRSAAALASFDVTSPRICPIGQRGLRDAWAAATARAGIHGVRLHDLRHEGITRLFERGWTIPQVAAVSGHRDWKSLKGYTHPSPQSLLELEKRT